MRLASIEITQRCEGACAYCRQPKQTRDLSPDRFRDMLVSLAAEGVEAVALGGGEPTLHPGLLELLALCREHRTAAGLTTNAARPDVVLVAARRGLLTQFGVSAGKGRWCELVGHERAVTNLLLLRNGSDQVLTWFTRAVETGSRCVLMMTYKGDDRRLRPETDEVARTLSLLTAAAHAARVRVAADDCTRRRLGLSSLCGRDFIRVNIDGTRQSCCFPDCEFHPPRS